MKKLKLTLISLTAMLVMGYQAQAQEYAIIGVTTNYDTLNVSLEVITNTYSGISVGVVAKISGSEQLHLHRARINNKDLLNIFAMWADASWPRGAKLVASWDAGQNVEGGNFGDVLVVDKTGTNVLYDATANYWGEGGPYFYVDFFDEIGVARGHFDYTDPGSDSLHALNSQYFELYDDYVLPYTSFEAYGGGTQDFFQNWDESGNGKIWRDDEDARFHNQANNWWYDSYAVVRGEIKAHGHGHGYNRIGAGGPI